MRLIDADTLLQNHNLYKCNKHPDNAQELYHSTDTLMFYEIKNMIDDAPTVIPERDKPKPPIPDENATGIDGKPVPRCQVCGYAMDLRMEQYCPCCGQRLTEYSENEVK